MKRFIVKLLVFLSPILILAVGMELLLRCVDNSYKYKSTYMKTRGGSINTLIMGSSHSFYGIDPDYLSGDAFNLSHPSQTLEFDEKLILKYENQLTSLKTLYLPISMFTLYGRLEDSVENWRENNYSLYYGIHTGYGLGQYIELFARKFKINVGILYAYYLKGEQDLVCSRLGWGIAYSPGKMRDLELTADDAVRRHTNFNIHSPKYREIFEENVATLKRIISWADKRNVKVILLTLPAYKTYRENPHLNSEVVERTIETAESVARTFGNCDYLNLYDSDSFTIADFYDADHLNHDGAEKLTRILNKYNSDKENNN